MKKVVVLLVLWSLLFSCDNVAKKSRISVYFPIDSLVEAQVDYLAASDAKLLKSNVDHVFDGQSQLLDSYEWSQEFEIFNNLNINKPTFVDAYRKRVYNDDKSNLNILNYSSIDDKTSVQEINIYYLKSLENIKRITATIGNQNRLYSSSEFLQMEFKKRKDLTVLSSYSITGNQKMMLRDSTGVAIFGKIVY